MLECCCCCIRNRYARKKFCNRCDFCRKKSCWRFNCLKTISLGGIAIILAVFQMYTIIPLLMPDFAEDKYAMIGACIAMFLVIGGELGFFKKKKMDLDK